ncbi:MAG TPA: hypothetical protein VFG23_12350 [Polyangia bacterium]|nr:hypothetical protein [Polyangia bacterium]
MWLLIGVAGVGLGLYLKNRAGSSTSSASTPSTSTTTDPLAATGTSQGTDTSGGVGASTAAAPSGLSSAIDSTFLTDTFGSLVGALEGVTLGAQQQATASEMYAAETTGSALQFATSVTGSLIQQQQPAPTDVYVTVSPTQPSAAVLPQPSPASPAHTSATPTPQQPGQAPARAPAVVATPALAKARLATGKGNVPQ